MNQIIKNAPKSTIGVIIVAVLVSASSLTMIYKRIFNQNVRIRRLDVSNNDY
ncbi:MAG: hypothetical protein ACRD8Z_15085 [Nitrososphaeraceae archaeon]